MKYITVRQIKFVTLGNETKRFESPPYIAKDIFGGRLYAKEILHSPHYKPYLPGWYMGISYHDFCMRAIAYHPIPLNYFIRISRLLRYYFWFAFYWVGLIDQPIGASFQWKDFLRIKGVK